MPCQYCPCDSGDLVGDRHDGDVAVSSLLQLIYPRTEFVVPPVQVLEQRSGSVYQKATDVGVTRLADAKQRGLPAGGALSWHQT